VNCENIGFCNSISAFFDEVGKVIDNLRLIRDFNRLLVGGAAEKRISCHGRQIKKADIDVSALGRVYVCLFFDRARNLLARDSFVLKAGVSEGPIALELYGGRADFGPGLNQFPCLSHHVLFLGRHSRILRKHYTSKRLWRGRKAR
jgi:hypothetical protein